MTFNSTASPPTTRPLRGLLVSLMFWTALLVAAVLFAAVTLAPRLTTLIDLRDEHYVHQLKLVALEQQTRQLERVVTALERDPDFAAEMARLEFDALRPGEEVIAVDGNLALDARQMPPAAAAPETSRAWYLPALQRLASQRDLRHLLLLTAAVLVVTSFTWLQESSGPVPAPATPRPAGRYRR